MFFLQRPLLLNIFKFEQNHATCRVLATILETMLWLPWSHVIHRASVPRSSPPWLGSMGRPVGRYLVIDDVRGPSLVTWPSIWWWKPMGNMGMRLHVFLMQIENTKWPISRGFCRLINAYLTRYWRWVNNWISTLKKQRNRFATDLLCNRFAF